MIHFGIRSSLLSTCLINKISISSIVLLNISKMYMENAFQDTLYVKYLRICLIRTWFTLCNNSLMNNQCALKKIVLVFASGPETKNNKTDKV